MKDSACAEYTKSTTGALRYLNYQRSSDEQQRWIQRWHQRFEFNPTIRKYDGCGVK